MKNVNVYAYEIWNGSCEDSLCSGRKYLFITDDKSKAEEYVKNYIDSEIEKDKYEDDNGNIVNHWWKYYECKESEIKAESYSVRIL